MFINNRLETDTVFEHCLRGALEELIDMSKCPGQGPGLTAKNKLN